MENFISQFRSIVIGILNDSTAKGWSIRQTVREIDQRLENVKRSAGSSQKDLVAAMERVADEEMNRVFQRLPAQVPSKSSVIVNSTPIFSTPTIRKAPVAPITSTPTKTNNLPMGFSTASIAPSKPIVFSQPPKSKSAMMIPDKIPKEIKDAVDMSLLTKDMDLFLHGKRKNNKPIRVHR